MTAFKPLDQRQCRTSPPKVQHRYEKRVPVFEVPVEAAFGHRQPLGEHLDPDTVDTGRAKLGERCIHPRVGIQAIFCAPAPDWRLLDGNWQKQLRSSRCWSSTYHLICPLYPYVIVSATASAEKRRETLRTDRDRDRKMSRYTEDQMRAGGRA